MLLGPTLSASNEGKKNDTIFNNKISTGAINKINPFFNCNFNITFGVRVRSKGMFGV